MMVCCLQEISGIIGPFLTWLLMQDRRVARLKLADSTVQVIHHFTVDGSRLTVLYTCKETELEEPCA
jgi:hypothetical protein